MGPRSRKSGHKTGQSKGGHQSQHLSQQHHPQQLNTQLKSGSTGGKAKNSDGGPQHMQQHFKSRSGTFSLQPSTAFKTFLSARLCYAIWSIITDCDETFNYWEPIHYLIHGKGFQTWEYSPAYAIRSYAYLWFYALPASFYSHLLPANKILIFYGTRCFLALFCSLCETYFYKGIIRQYGPNVGRFALIFMILSSGLFISATAVLPNTFSMYMVYLVIGAWLQQNNKITLLGLAATTLVGWPFSAIACAPVGLDLIAPRKRRFQVIKWSIIIGLSVILPLIAIDSYYYGKIVIAPVNIVLYNVFTSHGANLYGTEPWYFYILNCLLNFNFVFIAALLSAPLMFTCKYLIKSRRVSVNLSHWIVLSCFILWFTVMTVQAHKEERFLFPVYPFIFLLAGFTFDLLHRIIQSLMPKLTSIYSFFVITFIVVFSTLSISRSLAIYKGYHAPLDTFMHLSQIDQQLGESNNLPTPINVCLGKEWYRFPSSFFLPSDRWQLQFIQSDFRGQLPQPFKQGHLSTRLIPENMNDLNKEEPSRYIPVEKCAFLVDADTNRETPREPRYSQDTKNWSIIRSELLLDHESSPNLWRSFYIPFLFYAKNNFVNYNLLQNSNIRLN